MVSSAQYEFFQFRESPTSIYEKDFHNLEPLTKGMHGYSLLRPQLNNAYFHDLWDNCKSFGIPLEGVSFSFLRSDLPSSRRVKCGI